jgi:hypothetical protein
MKAQYIFQRSREKAFRLFSSFVWGLITCLLLICISSVSLFAQDNKARKVNPSSKGTINFKEIEKKEKQGIIKSDTTKKINLNEHDDKLPHHLKVPPGAKINTYKVKENNKNDTGAIKIKSKNKNAHSSVEPDFPGLHDNNTLIPPDMGGAVGPNHVMLALNTQVLIQDKTGTVLSTVSLNSIFSSLAGITFVFDPKILYDPFAQRWIITAPANPATTTSSLCIGVSDNSDPTGGWQVYAFDVDAADLNWFDYPSIGFNKNWIVVTGNLFTILNTMAHPSTFQGEQIYMFDKQALYAGPSSPTVTIAATSLGSSIVPAITLDNTAGTLYLVNEWNGSSGGSGFLRLYTVTGTPAAPIFGATMSFPSVSQTWGESAPTANFAPQNTVTDKFNNGDSRIQNAVFRNGSLWCTHHVFVPAASPTHTQVQWWQIDPVTNTVQQYGTVTDASATNFYAYPSIAVNAYNDVLLGYSSFSATQFASCNYSFRLHTDPVNTLQPTVDFNAGLAKYFKHGATDPRNRWGDYSSTCIDPDDFSMWTVQEFADNPISGTDEWNTEWNKVVPPVASLFVKDRPEDAGAEPDPSTLPMWQSEDIWLRKTQDATHTFAHITEDAEYRTGTSNPNYIYVEVRNRGTAASTGTEQLTLYWAKASSGLSWPSPWTGGVYFDPGPNTMLMGNVINTIPIPSIPGGGSTIFEFPWNPPNPAVYSVFGTDQNHFCLLARVTASGAAPYGMTFPETSDLYTNVQDNNKIAWKNIEVYDLLPGSMAPAEAIVANLSDKEMIAKFKFNILDKNGNPAQLDKGTLKITVGGKLKEILKQNRIEGEGIKDAGDGTFNITKDGGYVQNIHLQPKDFGTLKIEFVPNNTNDKLESFAINFTQLATENGIDRVIGGETFVYGNVQGFGTSPGGGGSGSFHFPWWGYLLIALLLLIIIIMFLKRK